MELNAERRKYAFDTPGISTGYWKARKTPACARSSGGSASRSFPSKVAEPPVTSYAGFPASTCTSVLLPEPLGPMIACTSPAATESEIPRRMSRSPALAYRSFISSTKRQSFESRGAAGSTDAALERDAEELLRLERELHRELLEHVLAESGDDHRHGVLLRDAALREIEDLILADLRRGRLVLHRRTLILHFDVREGVRAAAIPDEHRVALRVVARERRLRHHLHLAAIAVVPLAGRNALRHDGAARVAADVGHL